MTTDPAVKFMFGLVVLTSMGAVLASTNILNSRAR